MRLRYGFVIECRAVDVDSDGKVLRVVARYFADSRSGTAGADSYKVKGNIHWVSVDEALAADVHLYENLFTDPQPDSGEKDWLSLINEDAHRLVKAWLEPSLAKAQAAEHFQFERLGYFVADRLEHSAERPVFQRTVGLKQASR